MTFETDALKRIHSRRKEEVERAQRVVIATVLLLVSIGLLMIYSASPLAGAKPGSISSLPLVKQLAWCLLAGFVLLVACDVSYQLLERMWLVLLGATIILLAIVLVPAVGTRVNGARRWLRLGMMGLQPSELAKITMVIFLAAYLVKLGPRIGNFVYGVVPAFAAVGVVCGLVLLEPDVGTALFIAGISTMLLVAGGMRLTHFLPGAVVALPAVVYLVLTRFDHVVLRIKMFINPHADPEGKGLQILQSLIALGSGGLTGRGLGLGRQKLYFLPEARTDFVFSAMGEELGLFGCALVILLFCGFVLYGIKIALCAPDDFGCYLGLGIVLVIGCQAAANIAVATASIPTKGISLPFVSQGGSSLVIMSGMVGILLNISRQSMALQEARG